jgi:endonuclease IV
MTDNNNTGSVRITNKQIYEGLNDVNKTLALNNQKMDLHINHVEKKLGDHETRIRKVEESIWRSSWLTSVITAVITAIAVGLTINIIGV